MPAIVSHVPLSSAKQTEELCGRDHEDVCVSVARSRLGCNHPLSCRQLLIVLITDVGEKKKVRPSFVHHACVVPLCLKSQFIIHTPNEREVDNGVMICQLISL